MMQNLIWRISTTDKKRGVLLIFQTANLASSITIKMLSKIGEKTLMLFFLWQPGVLKTIWESKQQKMVCQTIKT